MVAAATSTVGFDDFFRAEYPKLVALAAGMTGSHDTACELAQEALLRCHRSWERVQALDVPGAWVRRVVINLATDVHRANVRAARHAGRVASDEAVAFGDPVIDGWWTVVRALPDRQRSAVVLHYVEDLSLRDVAAVLGITEGTVKATLAKARRTLARTLPREL